MVQKRTNANLIQVRTDAVGSNAIRRYAL